MAESFFEALIPVIVVIIALASCFTIRYELSDDALKIKIFGFPVKRIPYRDIVNVKIGYPFWGENFCRLIWRFWDKSSYVTIHHKGFLFKNTTITPENPEEFIRELKERLKIFGIAT
ncbi:MAG: PH domain-containing protein [bacterium]